MTNHTLSLLASAVLILLTGCKMDPYYTLPGGESSEAILVGDITEDFVLSTGKYHLEGTVRVRRGATLTIERGTVIGSMPGFDKYILVEQGAKIRILGTAEEPVVLCADKGYDLPGYWGGLIINGNAPICGATHRVAEVDEAERDQYYGGDDPHDDSGEIHYLIIDSPGASLTADVEHNGLTLNGVGYGTEIDHVAILSSGDDGLECFGGTVSPHTILVRGAEDDLVDLTDGYRGSISRLYGIYSSESRERGEENLCLIEVDGNLDGRYPDAAGMTSATITDCTLEVRGKGPDYGVFVRRGGAIGLSKCEFLGSGNVDQLLCCESEEGRSSITGTYSSRLTASRPNSAEGISAQQSAQITGCDLSLFDWVERYYQRAEAADQR